ncbi:MAG: HAMP domain-containing sensor histidine kinase [Roseiarcus sp.]|jgi:signal transduction histidine kinase
MTANSIRWRLAALAAFSIVVALTVACASVAWIFERHMERRVGYELGIRLDELLGAFTLEGGEPKLQRALSDPLYEQPLSGSYWQISDETGPVLESRSLWDQSLALPSEETAEASAFEIRWPDGTTLYAMDRQVDLDNEGRPRTFRLAVALNHADIDLMNRAFIGDVVKALVAIGFALFAGSWLQIKLGLRPLAQLQRSLAAIRKGRASRLPGDFPSEVAPLAQEFNTLLFRHADSLRKARERAGSLAHGLKTPLTILSAEASALDDRGIHDASDVLREQLGHMRRHVERELARARSHGSAAPGELHTDAKLSVARLMDLMRRMPRGADLDFVNALPEGLSLPIDPDDFGEIVGNLLDNARKYAQGTVTVAAANVRGRPAIVIDDDGPGIPAHLRERLTERGERADEQAEGAGLGLAIVRDLLADYGTDLAIEDSATGGCRIALMLPTFDDPVSRRKPDRRPAKPMSPGLAALNNR